jgi:hypothetical protein
MLTTAVIARKHNLPHTFVQDTYFDALRAGLAHSSALAFTDEHAAGVVVEAERAGKSLTGLLV